jgi:hypothetical protein
MLRPGACDGHGGCRKNECVGLPSVHWSLLNPWAGGLAIVLGRGQVCGTMCTMKRPDDRPLPLDEITAELRRLGSVSL